MDGSIHGGKEGKGESEEGFGAGFQSFRPDTRHSRCGVGNCRLASTGSNSARTFRQPFTPSSTCTGDYLELVLMSYCYLARTRDLYYLKYEQNKASEQ